MEHVPILPLVVITLLQLCRAQSSNSSPEWYAANDINDTSFSPKPITELFSTETSFSPEDPIVVLPPSSSLPSNRGVVSSPTPITLYNDSTDQPPNVIPLSSTELPSTPSRTSPVSQIITSITESDFNLRTTQNLSLSNEAPLQFSRGKIVQNTRPNQPPLMSSRPPPQPTQPRNIQFVMPTQSGNRIFQGQQLPSNGQSNVFVLYEQAPQIIRNIPTNNFPSPPPSSGISQPSIPLRDLPQVAARPPNMMRQPPPVSNQFFPQPNSTPPFTLPRPNSPPPNMPPPNIGLPPQSNTQQQSSQTPLNPPPNNNQQINNPPGDQTSLNPIPDIQQPNNRPQQPTNQITSSPFTPGPVVRRRPLRQRNRVNSGKISNRGPNRIQASNTFPCQKINNTVIPASPATITKKPVITIRLRPATISRNSMQINAIPKTNRSTTVRPRQSSQVNSRNYERCLNSCRDRKDRICAGPESQVQINADTLKGFPSMCHMACHNTFRANPIYEKIANGRCGKLRTRIQTVEKSKIKRDDLKKSQYTIISNIPGTVVELEP